jgi:hypothetical protein
MQNQSFRKILRWNGLTFASTMSTLLVSCGTYDFGDEPVTEVQVDTKAPQFNADIRPLMQLKCMNCHATPRPKHAPTSTPPFQFDDAVKFGTLLNKSVANSVFVNQTMPKNYGTPLTDREKLALKNYLIQNLGYKESDLKAKSSGGSTPVGGGGSGTAELPGSYGQCVDCHGDAGQATTFKVLKGTSLSLSAFKAIIRSGKSPMPAFPASKMSDSDVQAIYDFMKK